MGAQLTVLNTERGTTLIETVIATTLLMVVMVGLLSMAAARHRLYREPRASRSAHDGYAQDKMEQLLALVFTDAVSNTVVFPATSGGGSGLAVGGSSNTATPVNNYVDWLAQDGSLLGGGTAPPANWFYERVWQISLTTASVKQSRSSRPP